MKVRSIFFFVCLFSLLCGCMLKFEDVSEDVEYAPLLNTRYSLSTNMLIYGVSRPPGYGKDIDIYIIKPMNMRTIGSEILAEDTLKPETVLKARKVERSTIHIPFEGKRIITTVTVTPFEKAVEVPVVIDLKYIQSTNYMRRLEP